MRRVRQLAWVCGVAWLAVASCARAGAATPAQRDLLAHAAGESLWVAAVGPRPADVGPLGQPSPGPAEQTQVWVRLSRPNQHWRSLGVVPGRVASMAARESQLAVLLSDGQWLSVYDGGMATGHPLPAGGRLRALGDDGNALWAVGQVPGGRAAADAELARQAAATRAADDSLAPTPPPATRPATTATAAPSAAASSPGPSAVASTTGSAAPASDPLVLFTLAQGRWEAKADLPAGVTLPAVTDLSVAVVGHVPLVAYELGDGTVHVLRWAPAGRWDAAASVPSRVARGGRVADLQLLAGANGPLVWVTGGAADPGQLGPLSMVAAAEPSGEPAPHPLVWAGPPPLAGTPAAAVAGGYLRVVGPAAGGKFYEQRYGLDGAAVGGPDEVAVPPDPDSPLSAWVQGLLLASLTFTVGTSVYRQVTPAAGGDGPPPVTPAPLNARAAAGAIDLLPLLMGVLAAAVTVLRHPADPAHTAAFWLVAVGVLVYLAHTTALETLTARTAGKWVMGLRVVTPDGGRPAPWQLLARNLLRVVDPLVRIPVSALRQRTADVLANTVVVRAADPVTGPAGDAAPPPEPRA